MFDFSNFLVKHDISNSKKKKKEKNVKNSQQDEFLDFYTSIRENDFQIIFSIIKIRRQSRHKRFYRRFIIEFEFANQDIIIVKKKNIELIF